MKGEGESEGRKRDKCGGRKVTERVLRDHDSYVFISSGGWLKPRGTGLGRLLLGFTHR